MVRIDGIAAHNLDNEYVVTVDGLRVKYNAFSYGYFALNGTNENLKDVIKALYAYNQAAESYIVKAY